MLWDILAIAAGCLLLFFGGDRLLEGAISLGRARGWSAAIIGLVVVSLGTSAPELFVSAGSALQGYGDIAAGNVVGSNTVNIALVLGLAAAIAVLPVDQMLRNIQFPVMLLMAAVAWFVLADGFFDRADGLLVFCLMLAGAAIAFRRNNTSSDVPGHPQEPVEGSGFRHAANLLIGVLMLVAGAEFLILGAVALSRDLGVAEAVIALTVTAVGTSLPEIAATVIAVARRQTDLAVGNVVGSNMMNIGLVLGVSGMLAPFESGGITGFSLASMFGFCLFATLVAIAFGRFVRWTGVMMLAGYAVYLWYLLV
jgi:cation:H+ antiporter